MPFCHSAIPLNRVTPYKGQAHGMNHLIPKADFTLLANEQAFYWGKECIREEAGEKKSTSFDNKLNLKEKDMTLYKPTFHLATGNPQKNFYKLQQL